jgi:hypothetical protein
MVRAFSMNGGEAYKILFEKSDGKRLLGRSRYRWVGNIKMDLRGGMGWHGLD